jgi:hypothetical protein
MVKVMISFLAGLFVGENKFEEIKDNLDLERWFRLPKSHERRVHGHRHAGVRIVQEGGGPTNQSLGWRATLAGASGWCGLELVNAGRWGVPAPAGRLNSRGLGNWPVVPAADGIALKCPLALEAGLFVER